MPDCVLGLWLVEMQSWEKDLGSLKKWIWWQLLQFIRGDVQTVELLEEGKRPLWNEVQHIVV